MSRTPEKVGGGAVIRINLTQESSDEEVNVSSARNSDRISIAGAGASSVATYQRASGGGGGGREVVTISSDDDEAVCMSDTSISDIGMTTQFKNNNNPFETHNICIPILTEEDRADIYLLREQTPEEILVKIERNYDGVLEKIRQMFIREGKSGSTDRLDLVRIGYFKLSYNGSLTNLDDRLRVEIVRNPSRVIPGFQSVHQSFSSLPWLEYDEFEELFYSPSRFMSSDTMDTDESSSSSSSNIDNFQTLFEGLIEKTMYEMFIRKNLHTDSNFEQIVSIDLYPNRNKGSANIFHLDATSEMDVSFFTLTYFLPPDVQIKGPTVITRTNDDMFYRNQVTLLVKNGITIGIDNDAVLHSTSDPIVRVLPERAIDFPIPASNYHDDFYLHTQPKENLPMTSEEISEATESIEQMNRETDRKFARTWYIRSFREGSRTGIDLANFQLIPCRVNIRSLKLLIRDFKRNTNIIVVTDLIEPDVVIGLEYVQQNSLGGGVERGDTLYSELQSSYPLEKNDNININKTSYNDKNVSNPQAVSNNAPKNFTELFNKLFTENFIIRQSGKVIYSKKPNKGGKKQKNYNFLKYRKTKKLNKSKKSKKYRNGRKSRKSRKGRKTRK